MEGLLTEIGCNRFLGHYKVAEEKVTNNISKAEEKNFEVAVDREG